MNGEKLTDTAEALSPKEKGKAGFANSMNIMKVGCPIVFGTTLTVSCYFLFKNPMVFNDWCMLGLIVQGIGIFSPFWWDIRISRLRERVSQTDKQLEQMALKNKDLEHKLFAFRAQRGIVEAAPVFEGTIQSFIPFVFKKTKD